MKAIVILSGGPDSTSAALWALEEGYEVELVSFQFRNESQYGELKSAIAVADELELPHRIIDFKSPMHVFTEYMHVMMHAGVPELGHTKDEPYLMPFGVGTMLSLAVSYALHEQKYHIVWGATADDGTVHAEYSAAFCNKLSELVEMATNQKVAIHTPFSDMHKAEVLSAFRTRENLFSRTWSCRNGESIQCGNCEGCNARRVASNIAGVTDSTSYREMGFSSPLSEFASADLQALTKKDWKHIHDTVIMSCANPGRTK